MCKYKWSGLNINQLVNEFFNLQVSEISSATEEFLKKFAQGVLLSSGSSSNELTYDNLADYVEDTDSLSVLTSLIPRMITMKEYHRYNRPTSFTSFT